MLRGNAFGAMMLLLYLVCSVLAIVLLRKRYPLSKEVVRKLYHIMICFSIFPLLFAFETFYGSILALGTILLIARIVFGIIGKATFFSFLDFGRAAGGKEILKQMGYLFFSFALLITVSWGILGENWKFLAIAGAMALGFGDATAALVGKRWGKTKLKSRLYDGKKSAEGFLGMLVASGVAIFLVLLIFSPLSILFSFLAAVPLGWIAAFVEASSKEGLDTLFIPWSVAFSLYPLLLILLFFERWLA